MHNDRGRKEKSIRDEGKKGYTSENYEINGSFLEHHDLCLRVGAVL